MANRRVLPDIVFISNFVLPNHFQVSPLSYCPSESGISISLSPVTSDFGCDSVESSDD
jgi:hypothetical protein